MRNMKKRTLARILQAPQVIIFAIVVLAVLYIKIFDPSLFPTPVSWGTPIIITLIFVAYIWGRVMEAKHSA